MGLFNGVVLGYFEINLILMDPTVFVPILPRGRSEWWWTCEVCDEHPGWLATHLAQALENRRHFKPLTAEMLQVLRNHAAMLFRTMHSIKGENRALNPEQIADLLSGYSKCLGTGYNLYFESRYFESKHLQCIVNLIN